MLKDSSNYLTVDPKYLLALWRLRRLPRFGAHAASELRLALGSLTRLVGISEQELLEAGMSSKYVNTYLYDESLSTGFDGLIDWCQQPDQSLLLLDTPSYPAALACTNDAPLLLWARGNTSVFSQPMLAMVGSRNATPAALSWTSACAQQLAEQQITVVSGLALGVDAAAHIGAIQSGYTIAVMGTGADKIYPARHHKLASQILEQGLLLTEFPPGTAARANHFPSRNRIISGLCSATLVVEASIQSGSMITARLAAEQGRDVFALPGAINNPLARGPHQLIKDGALLVESAQDILDALGVSRSILRVEPHSNQTQQMIADTPATVSLIDFSVTNLDVISIRSQKSISELLPELLELELQGWISSCPGGYLRLK